MGEEKRIATKETVEGETPIQNAYSFSYIKRSSGAKSGNEVESYEKSIKDLGDFKTVQGFWRIYNHLIRPNELSNSMEYHLFKTGIKPMWEDVANRKGGKWMVRVRKGISSRYWEDLILAIIGEQFDVGNEICGAVVSIRYSEDVISLWNRNADNNEACYRIRDTMRKVLNLPVFVSLEYRRHDTSISDTNAARNNASTNANPSGNPTNRESSSTPHGPTNAWREQRSSSERSSNPRDGGHGSHEPRGRFTRGNSERGERGDRGDRSDRGDRGERGDRGSRSSSANVWSRDSKRPTFDRADSSSGSRPSGSEGKKSPTSVAPNPWGQK